MSGLFHRFDAAGVCHFFHLEAVCRNPERHAGAGALFVFDVGVALGGKLRLYGGHQRKALGERRKEKVDAGVGVGLGECLQVFPHRGGRQGLDRAAAAGAVELGFVREKELQVVVELRHRSHGGAGRAHRAALVDGDRGRNAVDAVHLGAVASLQELARVRAERFGVAPLAFGVEGVKGQGALS